jgi:3-oxoacyl-[acyl-carrier protein] reductase
MLKDKSVVITGSANGIGRYIAHRFAQEGANVAILDIDEEKLAQVQTELLGFGGKAIAIPTNVRNEETVRVAMAEVAEKFNRIDILVNDAGIVPHFKWGGARWPAIRDMDENFFWNVMGVNLGGTFLCSKHATPYMEQAGGGHIVNLYGGGGKSPAGALTYAVSKEAIVHFTDYHAEEVRDSNICVVAISPGAAIATENAPEEARSRMPGPESAGDRFLLASLAPMEMSGRLLDLNESGKLFVVNRNP